MTKEKKITPLVKETYLAVIKNSVGSKTWQNFYAKVGKEKTDIMKKGDLSCAFFASSILTLFGFIERVHGTVGGTLHDMEKSGWKKTNNLKPGVVVVWGSKVDERGESHKHIGFYLGDNRVVSNSSKTGKIAEHHITYGEKNGQPIRPIESLWAHKKLN